MATLKSIRATIQASIDANDRAVYKALLMIYDRQTLAEQSAHTTLDHNKVGFGAFDAEILTSYALQVRERGFLTPKQLAVARPKIRRYWRQLAQFTTHTDQKAA